MPFQDIATGAKLYYDEVGTGEPLLLIHGLLGSAELHYKQVMAWLQGRLDNAFGIVDKHLAQRTFMVGNTPTVADLSLCGYLFFPVEESGYPLAGRFPNIEAWLDRVRAIPGWADPYDVLPGERIAPKWVNA